MALRLVGVLNGLFEGGFVLSAPLFAAGFDLVAADGRQHAGGLFTAHHRYASVGPHKQKAWVVGAAAHAIVAGAKGAAD